MAFFRLIGLLTHAVLLAVPMVMVMIGIIIAVVMWFPPLVWWDRFVDTRGYFEHSRAVKRVYRIVRLESLLLAVLMIGIGLLLMSLTGTLPPVIYEKFLYGMYFVHDTFMQGWSSL